jgi:hypothetical protein
MESPKSRYVDWERELLYRSRTIVHFFRAFQCLRGEHNLPDARHVQMRPLKTYRSHVAGVAHLLKICAGVLQGYLWMPMTGLEHCSGISLLAFDLSSMKPTISNRVARLGKDATGRQGGHLSKPQRAHELFLINNNSTRGDARSIQMVSSVLADVARTAVFAQCSYHQSASFFGREGGFAEMYKNALQRICSYSTMRPAGSPKSSYVRGDGPKDTVDLLVLGF